MRFDEVRREEVRATNDPDDRKSLKNTRYALLKNPWNLTLDRRHTTASTAITSNIKLSSWGRYLGDKTLTAAILDSIVMNAIRADISGPSYRQYLARQKAKKRGSQPPPNLK